MHKTAVNHIEELKNQFDALKNGKDSLLTLIEEAEAPDLVFNSNAIENSTMTLQETEKLLLHKEVPAHHSQREIFEAVNLAKVMEYLGTKIEKREDLSEEMVLNAHETLLTNIYDDCAGRYRRGKEHVRVGSHIAPAPEEVPKLMDELFEAYTNEKEHILQRIIAFHLEFERIHPFLDGNGRTGRAFLNYQLKFHGYPPVIVPNKGKHSHYYPCFIDYETSGSMKAFEHLFTVLIKESLHKRIAYLRSDEIVLLSAIAKENTNHSPQSLTTLAGKQYLPAFREKGRWKVGRKAFFEWQKE